MGVIRSFGTDVTDAIPDIDPRQFGQGLWMDGLITYAECMAFVTTGAIPAAMQTALSSLADDDTGNPTPRKIATCLISGALTYMRSNPLVDEIAVEAGMTPAQMDANWRAWSLL